MDSFEDSSSKKKCPVCEISITHLGKHLKTHKLPEDEIKTIMYRNRKRRISKKEQNKKVCPLSTCQGLEPHPRLDVHFRRFHKMKTSDELYKMYINKRKNSLWEEKTGNVNKVKNDVTNKKCELTKSIEYHISQKFESYLLTSKGGNNDTRISTKMAYELRKIFRDIKIEEETSILTNHYEKKLENWLFSKIRSNSAITYCKIIRKYCDFLLDNHTTVNVYPINQLKDTLRCWKMQLRKNHRKTSLLKKQLKDINELEELVKSTALKKYEKYLHVPNTAITCAVHISIRNYLIYSALADNGCRPELLSGLTMKEFSHAIVVKMKDGSILYEIYVADHKTAASGQLKLFLKNDLYGYYHVYAHRIREFVLRREDVCECEHFFITWSGKRITSSDVNAAVNSIWKKTKVKESDKASKLYKNEVAEILKTKSQYNQ
ncbi:unnamed protein product, partial [Meganyctiphanes norvegica]